MDIKPSYESLKKLTKLIKFLLGNKSIKTIFEFGSRYGEDTVEFAKKYPNANIYAFECNPNTLDRCRENTKFYKNIILTEKAILNYDGKVSFYVIDKEKTLTTWSDGNQGASSLLKASGKYEIEKYSQKEITVDGISLKTFIIENSIDTIDVLWMDIQGAELQALKGLYDKIKKVKIMHIEVEFFEIYSNQPQFMEIHSYLIESGFKFLGFTSKSIYSGDAIFLNNDFYNERKLSTINRILNRRTLNKYVEKIVTWTHKINYSFYIILTSLLWSLFKILYKGFLRYLFKLLKYINEFDSSFPIYFPQKSKKELYLWYLKSVKPLFHIDKQYHKNICSEIPIDIFIPTVEKDGELLEQVILSAKQYIKHPIKDIYIIAAENQLLQEIAFKNSCVFINEDSLLGFSKEELKYTVNGLNRNGWLFQQLLKLSADNIVTQEYFLVLDSDTIFTRPKTFIYKNKMIFDQSEERHEPYHTVFYKIFGFKTESRLSFIAHYMIFNKSLLTKMKQCIGEKNGKEWINAIIEKVDYSNLSGFSEYETYGNYVLKYYRKSIIREFWHNYSTDKYRILPPKYFKSISVHSYKRAIN